MLILIGFASFGGDLGNASGIPCIILQAGEWQISPVKANYPNNIASLMSGISGLVWMPLVNCWGRMPVLFWSTVLGMSFHLGAILAPDFNTYYALRVISALNVSVGQTIGLTFVKDCFFFHEHARKIGIWITMFACAPFLCPMLGNFIIGTIGEWRPVFWMVFGWYCFLLCLLVMFGDETYYNRTVSVDQQPVRRAGQYQRLLRVLGAWQLKHHSGYFTTVISAYWRLLHIFIKPVILLMMIFYSVVFMWFLGIAISSSILLETPTSLGGYGLGPIGVGCVFITPIVGLLIGEGIGHWLNDYLVYLYGKRHQGLYVPEIRLYTAYISIALIVPGLILIGQTLHHHLPVVALVFGWGMNTVGILMLSVAVLSYALDCYPSASGEVSALINMGRVALGFSVGYFQQEWGQKQGFDVSFGLQAAVIVAAYVICGFVHKYGARMRTFAGPVHPLKY